MPDGYNREASVGSVFISFAASGSSRCFSLFDPTEPQGGPLTTCKAFQICERCFKQFITFYQMLRYMQHSASIDCQPSQCCTVAVPHWPAQSCIRKARSQRSLDAADLKFRSFSLVRNNQPIAETLMFITAMFNESSRLLLCRRFRVSHLSAASFLLRLHWRSSGRCWQNLPPGRSIKTNYTYPTHPGKGSGWIRCSDVILLYTSIIFHILSCLPTDTVLDVDRWSWGCKISSWPCSR